LKKEGFLENFSQSKDERGSRGHKTPFNLSKALAAADNFSHLVKKKGPVNTATLFYHIIFSNHIMKTNSRGAALHTCGRSSVPPR